METLFSLFASALFTILGRYTKDIFCHVYSIIFAVLVILSVLDKK